ncbi:regulator of chromosome condensation 1/beta-lactamase-inhibitor protein II [Cercophora newfieldiana]|uniref:Regulator of chromosome condensation 1/beta-lactamase-inhibitor protein II n=1 Tax=Cercophora newfieldiana TaxID=92897 RepID=A0AA39YB71_9PEZI|nr:regulator of chromosome condensation 1/beta-lactamase-inhibitor protein II [Cercophora newfieldiana]
MSAPMLSRIAARRPSPRQITKTSQWARHASSGGRPRSRPLILPLVAIVGVSGAAVVAYPYVFDSAVAVPETPEIVFEKPRKKVRSHGDAQDPASSQHFQVKKSWEQPGVYAWGSNAGRVVAPDSDEHVIKTPRRISYFDGQLLRDLKLDRDFGAAITENGDLVQWGAAFGPDAKSPAVTLKGKDLTKIATSKDRIIALSSSGSVYSIPIARADQVSCEKPTNSSWIPFWSGSAPISYRSLTPQLGWGEKVVDVKSGLEHCLLLTSKGRVFSAASSTESFPSRGQLGVHGLTWQTRPKGPFDQPHEITSLSGRTIKDIATGDFHSLVLDKDGQVLVFGDNSCGQLGSEMKVEAPCVDEPSVLRVDKLYKGTNMRPKVTSIAAGGLNSYFTVDATKFQDRNSTEVVPARELGRVAAETWACGEGIKGNLGNGKWTHVSSAPTKIKALSDLNEYDEKTNSLIPIRLSSISVGNSYACAILDNATNLTASGNVSSGDTNYGNDILWWGFNEFYQLGTGKRSNINVPTYIAPLDGAELGESTRMQITPRKTVRLGEGGSGRKVSVEQKVTCGRQVTAIFSSA